MTAPLIQRMLARLNEPLELEARGVLLADLACYYARIGSFDEAERIRINLRAEFAKGQSAPVSIMIMVLESMLLYFRELNPLARDRMLRAELLSKSFGLSRLVALTSAWLAHIDFNQGRYDSMAAAIELAFESISADDGSAACRLALVLGDAFLFCGESLTARRWYDAAHRSAVSLGDQAAVGALTYNRAALHVSGLRLMLLSGSIDPKELVLARNELHTAINYQSVAQLRSLDHLLRSSSVGVAILEGRFGDALAILTDEFLDLEVPPTSSAKTLLRADLVMCLACTGRTDEARYRLNGVLQMPLDDLDADDRALAYESLARAAKAISDVPGAETYHERSRSALFEHLPVIGEIRGLISEYANRQCIVP